MLAVGRISMMGVVERHHIMRTVKLRSGRGSPMVTQKWVGLAEGIMIFIAFFCAVECIVVDLNASYQKSETYKWETYKLDLYVSHYNMFMS